MKGWKLPLHVLLLILVCFFTLNCLGHRPEPSIEKPVSGPFKAKISRSVRKSTARSEQVKKMIGKTGGGDTAVKPYWCFLENNFEEATEILRLKVDYNCDGVADQCQVKHLNAYGETIRTEIYSDCGEVPTYCFDNEYNEFGEVTAYAYDLDCDSSIDNCLTLKRNDHGDIIETTIDDGCDGQLKKGEKHICYAYVYDEDGLIINKQKGDCGKEPESCRSYEYDLAAGIRRKKWDFNCDGTVNLCQVNVYREGNKFPDTFTENNCDGIWTTCNIVGEADWIGQTFKGHEVCAKKYEELVKKNMEKR